MAFHSPTGVGTLNKTAFAARYPAYARPYRLLVCLLTETSARLGVDVVRYTFIVEDLHLLLLASLLANLGDVFHPLTGSNRTLPSTAVRGSVGFAGRITGQHCVIQGWGGVEGRRLK